MSVRVEFTEPAREQIRTVAEWWRGNRPDAAELFEDELAYALDLLTNGPPLTQIFGEVEGKLVRKVRLPRTRYALYFTVDADPVTVHALWHGVSGSSPPLP